MRFIWRTSLRWTARIFGLALDLIGLAGVPGDWQTWGRWLDALSEGQFRLLLVAVGTMIVVTTLPWKRWLSNEKSPAAAPEQTPSSTRITEYGEGAQTMAQSHGSIQAGRDVYIQVPRSTEQTGSASSEAQELKGLRKAVGRVTERLGDYGPALSSSEDEDIRRDLRHIQNSIGDFAHSAGLRQALRDFRHHASWMLSFRSDQAYGGRRQFQSREEEDKTRRNLRTAHEAVLEASTEELIALGEPTLRVEIDDEASHIMLLHGYSSADKEDQDITLLDAHLGGIVLTNHSAREAHIEKIWLDIRGGVPVDSDNNVTRLRGESGIPGYSKRSYELEAVQVFSGVIPINEASGRVVLKIRAIEYGTITSKLPAKCFS